MQTQVQQSVYHTYLLHRPNFKFRTYHRVLVLILLIPNSSMANSLEHVFTSTNGKEWEDRIVILGGGIVGSSLAYFLSHKSPDSNIILLDASLSSPQGSTAFAPGLVGQLNEIDHLTQMAKESVEEYSKIHGMNNSFY
jgi:hypothetical protein